MIKFQLPFPSLDETLRPRIIFSPKFYIIVYNSSVCVDTSIYIELNLKFNHGNYTNKLVKLRLKCFYIFKYVYKK